jgi:hypothetical protein
MAAVTQWTCGPLHIVVRVEGGPPIRAGGRLIGAPNLMADIPLRTEGKVIVSFFCEIPLLPLAAINEGYVIPGELDQRIRLRKIGNNCIGMRLRIAYNIGHAGLAPTAVHGGMASLARGRPDITVRLRQHAKWNHKQQRVSQLHRIFQHIRFH